MCDDVAVTTYSTERVPRDDAGSMSLHLWSADSPVGSVLLIQEIFGVGPYIRAVAERLADAGYTVAAPDVFWRFAPGWDSDHTEQGLTASIEKVQQLDFPNAVGDCIAALDRLADVDGVDGRPAVMGFCLGGTLAWAVAAHGDPSCCVSYYGSGVPGMLDLMDHVSCPTLFHFGDSDAYIPNAGVEALAEAIKGRPGFVLNVEQAGHAFDNHESEMFFNENAAKAAWTKTLAFLDTHR